MARVKELLGYGLISAAIAVGGAEGHDITAEVGTGIAHLVRPDTPTFTDADRTEIKKLFEQNKSFWTTQHLAVAATKLVLVDGEATYTCPGVPGSPQPEEQTRTAFSIPEVCFATDTEVITPSDIDLHNIHDIIFSVAHETGHVADKKVGQITAQNWTDPSPAVNIAAELSANCKAGMEIETTMPEEIQDVADAIRHASPDDHAHGSIGEQVDALIQGTRADSLADCAISHFIAK